MNTFWNSSMVCSPACSLVRFRGNFWPLVLFVSLAKPARRIGRGKSRHQSFQWTRTSEPAYGPIPWQRNLKGFKWVQRGLCLNCMVFLKIIADRESHVTEGVTWDSSSHTDFVLRGPFLPLPLTEQTFIKAFIQFSRFYLLQFSPCAWKVLQERRMLFVDRPVR